jgi:hypothetical protein
MGLGSWGADGSAAWIAVGTDGKLQTGNIGLGSCASSVQASTLTKQWLHITGIVSSGDFRLYQDGQLINSTNTAGTINYGTNPVLYLATRANASGSPESTRYFDCKIANARLFNRALSSDEIYQLYAYQKEYFGLGDLSMTLKAGRLGIGTSEPRAALDVRGDIMGGCPVLFRVNIQSASNSSLTPTSGAPPIVWNNVSWNVGGGYNSSTGIFTAPIQGYYSFSHWAMTNGNQNLVLLYYINGSDSNDLNPVRSEPFANKNGYSHVQNSGTTTFKMRAGDQLYIALTSGNIFVSAVGSAMYNNFEGYYLSSW